MDENKRFETQQNEENSQEQKTFTQEEVNEIVQRRLAREQQKKRDSDPDLADRENTLEERELKVMAREKLLDEGLPRDLADVLRYSDEESLNTAIETIKNLNMERVSPKAWGERVSRGKAGSTDDPIREAMGLTRQK